ncbi:hypothetical protein [Paracoccus sp. SSK6]|uniref:hypothetical protein n=1 Tax=Paracoccus sp. SSK6 TaxID=3143131 RepID=UPI003219BE43
MMRADSQDQAQCWLKPSTSDGPAEPGYDEWLTAEIARGIAELDAGRSTPIEDVRREFGQE